MKKTFLTLLAATALCASAETPLWMRDVSISPDGKTIAFTYKGDIFTVPTAGGKATQLTATPNYETTPVWSPDSRSIAYATDRNGGMDIYIIPAAGGEARRLTSHSTSETPEAFTPDGKALIYSAFIQAPAASRTFPTARMPQLYSVAVDGSSAPVQIMGTAVRKPGFLKDGKSFVYQDVKGFEDDWRKHHTSSVTRDIWLYDATTGKHTNLTARGGEDLNPVVDPASSTVYFLSERGGDKSINVWSAPLSDMSKATRVTEFATHPVRFLSRADNGVLSFGYDGEIYTLEPGGKPRKVAVDIVADYSEPAKIRNFAKGATGAVPSPDGKQVAFASRGDIFVTSTDYVTTKQITTTPQGERQPSWGADNRTLYYTSDRDGHDNIYRARISRKDDPNFPNATIIEETAVFPASDGIERSNPIVSPDGQKIAYIRDRRKIAVYDLHSHKETLLTNGETYTANDAGIEIDWSPDSEWLAAIIDTHKRDPYYDIALYRVSDGKMVRVTNDAYTNHSPRWVMGGNAVIFLSDRYGMKNLASWGSQDDVLIAFTNKEAYDRYRLSPEDFALLKEVEKSQKKDKEKAKDDKKGKKDKKAKKDAATDEEKPDDYVNVEEEGIEDRIVRLTPFSSDLADAYIDNDGENLYFLSRVDDGYDLWKMDMRKDDVELYKKLGASSLSILPDAAGKNIFLLGPSAMKKMALAGGKTENITYAGVQKIDPAAERDYMFDYILTEEAKRFLVKDMFGADWKGLGEAYRRYLPHINNNYDFAEMASELLGELNVSHTGARYYPAGAKEPTAALGLIYDLAAPAADGLKVTEVIAKGPFDRKSSRMVPGAVITAINGEALTELGSPMEALNLPKRAKMLVSFTLPSGEKVEEVVIPITTAQENNLLYDRWVERNRATVDSLSGGRLGYVHIRSMDDASYRRIYADVLGRYADREGIVIDTRWNGGGRLHEDIEVLFSGKKYLDQEIRGVKSGEMPSKRWLRPSVMITCEANYSNAHGTPWMYHNRGLGKIVGMPVPGTMSSVNWIDLQDDSMLFGVPVVGFRNAQGQFLENQQLEPDVKVANDPAVIVTGRDQQLEKAVETLLNGN
ncbi:MAG: S41 family peptidase [Muribaculaceae bacterium]|nr:S41 family peptidase [Muribaculaceae bacterium]